VKTADVVIVGSGSLAQGIVYALSQVATNSMQIAVIGRSDRKISRIALIANARGELQCIRSLFPFSDP
jgi:shikimate 5-dehydrogenase